MKVKITGYTGGTFIPPWYYIKIGEVFSVKHFNNPDRPDWKYKVVDGEYRGQLIYKSDCEIVEEPFQGLETAFDEPDSDDWTEYHPNQFVENINGRRWIGYKTMNWLHTKEAQPVPKQEHERVAEAVKALYDIDISPESVKRIINIYINLNQGT